MEDRKFGGSDNLEICTPEILKTFRRTQRSPSPIYRLHPPPSKSGVSQSTFSGYFESDSGKNDKTVQVFGYPEYFKDLVIDKFKRLGKIDAIKESEGNWLSITYQDVNSAVKALSYNYQYIAEGVMISVKYLGGKKLTEEASIITDECIQDIESTQYLKKEPRRNAGVYEKIMSYIFNID